MTKRALLGLLVLAGGVQPAAAADPAKVAVWLAAENQDDVATLTLFVEVDYPPAQRFRLGARDGRCEVGATKLVPPLVAGRLQRYVCRLDGRDARPQAVLDVGLEAKAVVVREAILHFASTEQKDLSVLGFDRVELVRVPLPAGATAALAEQPIPGGLVTGAHAFFESADSLFFSIVRGGAEEGPELEVGQPERCLFNDDAAYRAAFGKPMLPPVVASAACAVRVGELDFVLEAVRKGKQLIVRRTDLVTADNPLRKTRVIGKLPLGPDEILIAPLR